MIKNKIIFIFMRVIVFKTKIAGVIEIIDICIYIYFQSEKYIFKSIG